MRFTARAWAETASVRAAITAHPFVVGMGEGTLPSHVWAEYLRQDVHYLRTYAEVLARCATLADTAEDGDFWAGAASRTIAHERDLHARLGEAGPGAPSDACRGYAELLLALADDGAYPVLVAGVLPCYWVYADVAARLVPTAGDLGAHPFGPWLAFWSGAEFAGHCATVRGIADRVAAGASGTVRELMLAAFDGATRWEHDFWDAAWQTGDAAPPV